jgi:hypothetical protein
MITQMHRDAGQSRAKAVFWISVNREKAVTYHRQYEPVTGFNTVRTNVG